MDDTMKTNPPRQLTVEEMREFLLRHVWALIQYWGSHDNAVIQQPKAEAERLQGLAFSILTMLDGESLEIPGFLLIPNVAAEDKEYYEKRGECWWPPSKDGDEIALSVDVGGALHEQFHNVGRKLGIIT